MEIQDTTKAIGFYEQTVKMDSTYDKAILRLGSLYLSRSEYDKAISLFSGLMKVDPDNYAYYLYAGIAYHRAGRLDEALKAYQKGHELNPDEPLFSTNMGKIYYQREEYALAAERLEEVAGLQDGDVDILQLLSACYSQLSDYEKAAGTYERIVAVDPAYPNGYKNLGIWYGKLKQYDKAIDALTKGIESSPENERSEIYLSLVDIYLKAGNYGKVIEVGNNALSYKPNIRIYVFLGDAYQAMGEALEKENTSASFGKAIENYKSSTANYNRVVKDAKYGKYARQSIQRNDDLIERAELIIKKLRLEEG